MKFYMPVKVYNEPNCVRAHGSEWATLGHKALIVTGRSSAKNGALADVTAALEAHQTDYCIFDRTEENPSIEMIMEVRDFGVQEKVDFVIGIGGGSPMDAAKAIALMIHHQDQGAEYLYAQADSSALPVVAVPTTCGTGSEVTPISVLTIHAQRTKASIPHRIFPEFALVDGKYLERAPRHILLNTAVDALGHLLESYINVSATAYTRMICEYGLNLWNEIRPALESGEITSENRDKMMLASTLAGMAITHTGTALPHGLSYFVTYEMHIPHGQAVGYFLPGYVAVAPSNLRNKALGLIGCADSTHFKTLIQSLIGTLTISDEMVQEAVNGILSNEKKLKAVPYPVNEELLYHFFETAK